MRYHLKLVKGLSYHGVISATVKNPDVYTDDKAIADKAVNTGYFEVVDNDTYNEESDIDAVSGDNNDELFNFDDENNSTEDFGSYTVKELRAYAKEHNIDISHCENKADYINAIKEGKEYES